MKKSKLPFQIESPCHEPIEKMHPNAEGWHCDQCDKQVFDLSKHSDQQVEELLKNGGLCTRIQSNRIHFPAALTAAAAGILATLSSTPAYAQGKTYYANNDGDDACQEVSDSTQLTLSGVVQYPSGAPMPLATIRIGNASATCDNNGNFNLKIENSSDSLVFHISPLSDDPPMSITLANPRPPSGRLRVLLTYTGKQNEQMIREEPEHLVFGFVTPQHLKKGEPSHPVPPDITPIKESDQNENQ